MAHWAGGTYPTLHILTEMFHPENLHWLYTRKSGTDCIGTDDVFFPATTDLKVVASSIFDDMRIARSFYDEAAGVSQDHHRLGFCKEKIGSFNRRTSGGQQIGVLGSKPKDLGLASVRCLALSRIDAGSP
jgi:hypothetical protein